MGILNYNPKNIIFALDIGTRFVIGTVGVVKDEKFHVLCESCVEHQERAIIDGQIHDISLVASAVSSVKKELEDKLKSPLKDVRIAAAGRFLRTTIAKSELEIDNNIEIDKDMIRSLELNCVNQAEKKVSNDAKGRLCCVAYSVKNYYLNDYIISDLLYHKGDKISAEIIVTFLPRIVIESLYAVMEKVGLNVISLTLEPIAAMEAVVPKKMRLLNLALVDIGAGTSDIAISSKDSISAYGMVPLAGDEVTEAIAQSCLVDFNTADKIKKECTLNGKSKYVDVLDNKNTIGIESILKITKPNVDKIALEIANKVIELNSGKPPSAVFLVGGGAYTPNLKEFIAKRLGLSLNRITIKNRESVSECICQDNNIADIGVTVLGIALVSMRKMENSFIDVLFNGKIVSLFNTHNHTVMDVLIQSRIDANVLMGKNGENIRFKLNGENRISFGSMASSAIIKVNGEQCSIDFPIKEGDNIEIKYAKDGKTASPKILDYTKKINSVSFYLDNEIKNMDPIFFINNNIVSVNENISDGDDVRIIYPKSFGEYKKYFLKDKVNNVFYYMDDILYDNHIICKGDKIYSEKYYIDYLNSYKIEDSSENTLTVIVNNKEVNLKGKESYIFIDIFDNIEFDLTRTRGNLALKLNNKKAGYYDKLKKGDIIEIYWE